MLGSAALDIAYVATGRLDAYIEGTISLWDIAAGLLLVPAAGGVIDLQPHAGNPGKFRITATNGRADFASLIAQLSEPEGYFDTDNLISNESTFLTVAGHLRTLPRGGVYLGVGPDQSVSSLSCSRSLATPPKTMAPRRPLPTGNASTHWAAGWRYQSLRGEVVCWFMSDSTCMVVAL
jgi:hypothetical protein